MCKSSSQNDISRTAREPNNKRDEQKNIENNKLRNMKTMLIDLKVYVLNKPTIEKQIKTQKTRSGAARTWTMFFF